MAQAADGDGWMEYGAGGSLFAMCSRRFLCSPALFFSVCSSRTSTRNTHTHACVHTRALSEYIHTYVWTYSVLRGTVAANGENWLCEKAGREQEEERAVPGWGGNFNFAGCTWQQVCKRLRLQLRVKVSARASAAAHV